MTGIVEIITTERWNDRTFYKIKIAGNIKDYACWQGEGAKIKKGDTIEFTEEEKNGKWRLILPKSGVSSGFGGARGKSPEEIQNQLRSFAVSYSKDITVALLQAGANLSDPIKVTLDNANVLLYWLQHTK
jgi:hypothetical protein